MFVNLGYTLGWAITLKIKNPDESIIMSYINRNTYLTCIIIIIDTYRLLILVKILI